MQKFLVLAAIVAVTLFVVAVTMNDAVAVVGYKLACPPGPPDDNVTFTRTDPTPGTGYGLARDTQPQPPDGQAERVRGPDGQWYFWDAQEHMYVANDGGTLHFGAASGSPFVQSYTWSPAGGVTQTGSASSP